MRDGYITRFQPEPRPRRRHGAAGRAGPPPPRHLALGCPSYGSGPFFAAGEEKTIAPFPRGYGMPVKATDSGCCSTWSTRRSQQPMEAYITYDVDFIPKAQGDELGMKPAYPLWLDVRPSGYPVFNVQRELRRQGRPVHLAEGEVRRVRPVRQGDRRPGQARQRQRRGLVVPEEGRATSARSSTFTGGTLIGIGGHLHPGGIQNEIDLVRGKKKRRIYTGVANYWNPKNRKKGGGPVTRGTSRCRSSGCPFWGVRVRPGDKLRSNATYDTRLQSTYENMGIAVSLLVPDDENGKPQAPGVNPFTTPLDTSKDCLFRGGIKAPRPVALQPRGSGHARPSVGERQPRRPRAASGRGEELRQRERGRDRRLPLRAG